MINEIKTVSAVVLLLEKKGRKGLSLFSHDDRLHYTSH